MQNQDLSTTIPQKKENILKRYPLIPAVFFILFAWGLLHLITSFKSDKKKLNIPRKELIFSCNGTEPFWNLEITQDNIIFKSSENIEGLSFPSSEPKNAEGFSSSVLQVFESKKKHDKIKIFLLKSEDAKCSNGMSEEKLPYSVIIDYNDAYYYGCCQ